MLTPSDTAGSVWTRIGTPIGCLAADTWRGRKKMWTLLNPGGRIRFAASEAGVVAAVEAADCRGRTCRRTPSHHRRSPRSCHSWNNSWDLATKTSFLLSHVTFCSPKFCYFQPLRVTLDGSNKTKTCNYRAQRCCYSYFHVLICMQISI